MRSRCSSAPPAWPRGGRGRSVARNARRSVACPGRACRAPPRPPRASPEVGRQCLGLATLRGHLARISEVRVVCERRTPPQPELFELGPGGSASRPPGGRGNRRSGCRPARRRLLLAAAAALAPRMCGLVRAAQVLDRHPGVDLGRRDRGVAEQLLDDPDVGAVGEHVGGAASGAARGGGPCPRGPPSGPALEHQPRSPGGSAARPGLRNSASASPRRAHRRGSESGPPPGRQPALEGGGGLARRGPCAPWSLSEDPHQAGVASRRRPSESPTSSETRTPVP